MYKELELRGKYEAESRLTRWWPKVEAIDVPKPETIILPFPARDILSVAEPEWGGDPRKILDAVARAADTLGYPVFLRTDLVSGKHGWKNSCYVATRESLPRCLFGVVEANLLADVVPEALVVRRYIPLVSAFTAFYGDMPVAKERRYFVENGRVLCHHPYWPEDAIRFPGGREPEGWRERLAEINEETSEEVELLGGYAARLAAALDGFWSVDFALGRDGVWYFIDAARGEISWHPECGYRD
ncbi:MAG: ATP-grasp domain-containing protein [Moorellaceae bacterium]